MLEALLRCSLTPFKRESKDPNGRLRVCGQGFLEWLLHFGMLGEEPSSIRIQGSFLRLFSVHPSVLLAGV